MHLNLQAIFGNLRPTQTSLQEAAVSTAPDEKTIAQRSEAAFLRKTTDEPHPMETKPTTTLRSITPRLTTLVFQTRD